MQNSTSITVDININYTTVHRRRPNLLGYEGYRYPTLWTGGTVPILFKTQVKNLLTAEAICGN